MPRIYCLARPLSTYGELQAGFGHSKAFGLMRGLLSSEIVVECVKVNWDFQAFSDSLQEPASFRRVQESWQHICAQPDRRFF